MINHDLHALVRGRGYDIVSNTKLIYKECDVYLLIYDIPLKLKEITRCLLLLK